MGTLSAFGGLLGAIALVLVKNDRLKPLFHRMLETFRMGNQNRIV